MTRRTQAEHLREHTAALLEPIELAHGARALDLGCGPGGALEMLSDFVGPGGRVLGVDLDAGSVATARTSAQDRGNGADLCVARRLPHLLATAGMEKISVEARAPVCPPGDPQRTVCLDLVQTMRSKLLRWGLIGARELDRLDEAARLHLDHPGTLSVPVTHFAAWARKPAADASSG